MSAKAAVAGYGVVASDAGMLTVESYAASVVRVILSRSSAQAATRNAMIYGNQCQGIMEREIVNSSCNGDCQYARELRNIKSVQELAAPRFAPNEWELLISLLTECILQAQTAGVPEDHSSSKFRRDLRDKLLFTERRQA